MRWQHDSSLGLSWRKFLAERRKETKSKTFNAKKINASPICRIDNLTTTNNTTFYINCLLVYFKHFISIIVLFLDADSSSEKGERKCKLKEHNSLTNVVSTWVSENDSLWWLVYFFLIVCRWRKLHRLIIWKASFLNPWPHFMQRHFADVVTLHHEESLALIFSTEEQQQQKEPVFKIQSKRNAIENAKKLSKWANRLSTASSRQNSRSCEAWGQNQFDKCSYY